MKTEVYFIGQPQDVYSSEVSYSSLQAAVDYLEVQKVLAIDLETGYLYPKDTFPNEDVYKPGLDPYLSRIVMLQIGTLEKVFVIDIREVVIDLLLPVLNNTEITFVTHNGKFEAKFLSNKFGVIFRKFYDTMLCGMNLTNGLGFDKKTNPTGFRYSLEAVASRYLGIKSIESINLFNQPDGTDEIETTYIDKSTRMGFLHIGDKPFTEKQILYGVDDIVYPLRIKAIQEQGVGDWNPKALHDLENEFCLVLADIELRGITFDKEQWMHVYDDISLPTYKRRLKLLDDYIIKNFPKYYQPADLFLPAPKCSIDWASNDVIKFFKHLEICPKEKSKQTGRLEYTVGAKALLKLLPIEYKERYEKDQEVTKINTKEDLILSYLLLNTVAQSCNTFGKDWLKYIHPITGRVHSTYKQILNTGRISSNNPNMQNLPSDTDFRKAFVAGKDNILLNCDFSAQEARDLAEVTEDMSMLSFFNDGHPIHGSDIHCFVATSMFSLMRHQPDLIITKKANPEERQAAKAINFLIAYGGSAHALKDTLGTTEEEAQKFIDSYMDAFPSLKKNFEKAKKEAVERGWVEIDSITGRRYFYPLFASMKKLSEDSFKHFPEDYKKMSKEQKVLFKAELYKIHPELQGNWSRYFTMKGELERIALNFRIQGLAAAQTKMAGILFRRRVLEQSLQDKVYLTNLIHDEAVCECAEELEDIGTQLLKQAMIDGGNYFCKKVKMDSTGGKCDYWGH